MASSRVFLMMVETSPLARRLLWHLYSASRWTWQKPTEATPFSKPGACIVWIRDGQMQLRLDDTLLELEPGNVLCYSTARLRQFLPPAGKACTSDAIWVNGPGLDAWLEELDVINRPQILLRDPRAVPKAIGRLVALANRRQAGWELAVHHELGRLLELFMVARGGFVAGERTQHPGLVAAMNAIDSDPRREWSGEELARRSGMSYSSFRTEFRKSMNESPHAYIMRVRLDQARQMLNDPKLRIKEIAAALRFSSMSYFSSFFRQHTGLSPVEFRRKALHLAH